MEQIDPDARRADALLRHHRRDYATANAAFRDAMAGYFAAGRLGDACTLADDLITVYERQLDFKAAFEQERRALKLSQGVDALDLAALADQAGDRDLTIVELQRAHAYFLESGYADAWAITEAALTEFDAPLIDLTLVEDDHVATG